MQSAAQKSQAARFQRHPVRFLRLLQSHREFRCSEGLIMTLGRTSRMVSGPNNADSPRLGLLLGARALRLLSGKTG